jgi:fatty-acid desaturase
VQLLEEVLDTLGSLLVLVRLQGLVSVWGSQHERQDTKREQTAGDPYRSSKTFFTSLRAAFFFSSFVNVSSLNKAFNFSCTSIT